MASSTSRAGIFLVLFLLIAAAVWSVLAADPSPELDSMEIKVEAEAPDDPETAEMQVDEAGPVRSELEQAEVANEAASFSLEDLSKKFFGGPQARQMHIRGQVLSDGQPALPPSVAVYIGQGFSNNDWLAKQEPAHIILCDGLGNFELTLRADSVRLIPLAEGYQAKDVLELLNDAPAECLNLELQLFATSKLSGTVVDEAGQPIADAEIKVLLNGRWQRHRAASTPGASYRALNLPTWKSQIDGSFSGQLANGTYTLHGSQKNPNRKGSTTAQVGDVDVQIKLMPVKEDQGSRIFGVVLMPDGRPAAEAQVLFSVRSKRYPSNTHGEFEMTGLKKHWSIAPEVEAWAPGAAPVAVAIEALEANVGPLRIQLPQGHEISGVVLDEQGKAAAGKKIHLQGLPVYGDGSSDRKTLLSIFPGGSSSKRLDRQVSDSQGRFRFVDLPFAEYTVVVQGSGRIPAASAVVFADTTDLELQLGQLLAPSLTIYGQVSDANSGSLLEGIRVNLNRVTRSGSSGWSASSVRSESTNAKGKFRFESLDPAEYYLEAKGKGFAQVREQPQVFKAEEVPFELRMYPTRLVNVQVVDAAGKPVSGASIRVNDPLGHEMMIQLGGGSARTPASCDDEGRVIMHEMPGGLVKMIFSAQNGGQTVEQSVDLRSQGEHQVVLKLDYAVARETMRVKVELRGLSRLKAGSGPFEFHAVDPDGFALAEADLSWVEGKWIWKSGYSTTDDPATFARIQMSTLGGTLTMDGPGMKSQVQVIAAQSAAMPPLAVFNL